jgi:hypothetical protein
MNSTLNTPKNFVMSLCKSLRISNPNREDHACVINRSPSCYGDEGGILIELEGSPPKISICWGYWGLIVNGKAIKCQHAENAVPIIRSFLNAHPANPDGTPVWIGTRFKERS